MADDGLPEAYAPTPAEFTRNLRCCVTCRLVKTLDQFYEQGCENCVFLEMAEDRERIEDCTTTEFQVRSSIHPKGRSRCHQPPFFFFAASHL